ncbi:MAG: methyltransferase domain-containing protein [Proteobacteria bacterium]|nr:MAG: methyltransferase domain-containing protein [Pseudomonadota bacterium]
MRLPAIQECDSDFQKEFAYGDDTRQFFHPYPKKPGPFSYHLRLGHVVAAFREFLPPPAEIADVACAAGNFALTLAEAGYKVTGVDLLEDFIRYARLKRTGGEVEFVQGNLMDYQHPRPLDGILMGEVIEHVAWPEKLIAAAAKNLRVGGIFVLTTPNGSYGGISLPTFKDVTADRSKFEEVQFHHGHHLFLYTPEELAALLEAGGFEVLRVEVFNSHYLTKRTTLRYALPKFALRWLDGRTSKLKFENGQAANMMYAVARKRA